MYSRRLCHMFQTHRAIFRKHIFFKGVYCIVHLVNQYSLRHVVVVVINFF
jgi:hypothetical protein